MNNLRFEQQIRFLIEIDKLKSVYRQNYLVDGLKSTRPLSQFGG